MTHDANLETFQYSGVISKIYVNTEGSTKFFKIDLKVAMSETEKNSFMLIAGEGGRCTLSYNCLVGRRERSKKYIRCNTPNSKWRRPFRYRDIFRRY